jgi:hypothetical protein
MKRLLLIALVATGLAFVPVQRYDAQISVGIGYPGYGHGYYPYGYYRPYPLLWLLLWTVVLLVRRLVLPFSAVIHRAAKNLQRNIGARDQERDVAIPIGSCVLKECGRRRCAGGLS